jgi:YegS/Rv2252/BmrU family lipid kinase
MKPSLFIVNPISGGKKNRRVQEVLRQWVLQQMPQALWQVTAGPGDATRLAAEAAGGGVERIFPLGGDGTLNEVLQGIATIPDPMRPAVGILGGGTGGDYARGVQEQFGNSKDWNWLLKPQEIRVDFGKVMMRDPSQGETSRYFLNVADGGLPGAVVRQVNQGGKGLGRWQYLLATLKAGRHYRAPRVKVEGFNPAGKNFSESFPLMVVVVAKGRYFGGGMAIAPQARLADGLFQVMVAGNFSYLELLRQLPNLYRRRPLVHPNVCYGTATWLKVTVQDGALPLDLDGESFLAQAFEIAICPKGLRILIPSGGSS